MKFKITKIVECKVMDIWVLNYDYANANVVSTCAYFPDGIKENKSDHIESEYDIKFAYQYDEDTDRVFVCYIERRDNELFRSFSEDERDDNELILKKEIERIINKAYYKNKIKKIYSM